ncbi:glutamate-1-semialdehyde 2,1-aminomutase [Echinicola vietnamensis]|uniref:Glutamate-1-semialdehyde 2,1-aminomutase n=1 Tax=Echinicola vietnamensis (strain DSM 17526 / LMG 23754 / KMM 6221) TaxID=926556 RepID=L0FT28_ECHVK|nr:glutamate-1-semialdehyde 2,1-aminomutase [Echinicola vietnamensis]AGA76447.1 glutamate-1-semialdehyde-2,1-aminomutase [Echinicola vietnamensis DSM 17526]
MNIQNSKTLFSNAQNFIPGGVNSPVRAFKAVGGDPLFIKKAEGAYLFDEDDNRYIELINSWGPMILGHNHPEINEAIVKAVENGTSFGAPTAKEIDIAELICKMVPSVEKVRMVNSGTEATMSAVRLARGYTGRDKFLKFEGNYHGHGDSFLIAAGSGAMTMGAPNSPGVTKGTAKDTLLAPYNDLNAVKEVLEANRDEVAAIILEPVPGNMGLVLPNEGFLQGLRKLCDEEGIVLIFDEVMTGFRLAQGGAQEVFGVTPDLTTMGKIIGGGMPVGAYGGKKEIMDFVSPVGPVYQAGTLSGNPIAMAAGFAMLDHLYQHPEVYQQLDQAGSKLVAGVKSSVEKLGLEYTMTHLGSMYSLFFTKEKVVDFETAKTSDTVLFGKYFQAMLKRGVYLPPSQFESLFLSTALTDEHIDQIIDANEASLREIL